MRVVRLDVGLILMPTAALAVTDGVREVAVGLAWFGARSTVLLAVAFGGYLALKYVRRHRSLRGLRMARITVDELPLHMIFTMPWSATSAVPHPFARIEPGARRRVQSSLSHVWHHACSHCAEGESEACG